MSDTLELELREAREAKQQLDRLTQAAKQLPQLEKQQRELQQQERLEQQEQILLAQFQSAIADYKAGLQSRNDAIKALVKSLNDIIDDSKAFDTHCDSLLAIARELANVQLHLHGSPLGWIDPEIVKGTSQDLLKKEGCFPVGAIALDTDQGQQLMIVLQRYIKHISQPKRELQRPTFLMATGNGEYVKTY